MMKTHYVLSVHWDREWYQTLEEFRMRLIPLMDEVLEGLEGGEMKGPFVTDGQTILLDDYLEMRPEAEEKVKAFIGEGKISAGAWYVMPDLFQVSGESLIRNIEWGMERVKEWGGKAPLSLNCCDVFGLNSQMPQIAAGFALKSAFLWRGINETDHRNLIWEGADGTRLPCFRFGLNGYWHYTVRIREGCDRDAVAEQESFDKRLAIQLREEQSRTDIDRVLLFDGMDHSHWDREYYKLLFGNDANGDIIHSTLDEVALELSRQQDKITTLITGEQREPGDYDREEHALLAGTLSSRTYLKRENARCEHLLTNLVEPWAAYETLSEGADRTDELFIRRAWQFLLQNHPHDSICGTSIDEVHRDMMNRFRQCGDLGEKVLERTLERIALGAGSNEAIDDNTIKVVLFQSLPSPGASMAEVTFHIPVSWRTSDTAEWAEGMMPGFDLRDEEGNKVPLQILQVKPGQNRYHTDRVKSVSFYKADEVRCLLDTNLTSMGYRIFYLHKSEEGDRAGTSPRDILENEYLKVTVQDNGRVSLFDKRNGHGYKDLFSFESEGERGSPFHHVTGLSKDIRTDLGAPFKVKNLYAGEFGSSLAIVKQLELPRNYDFARDCRSDETDTVSIEITLTLRKGDTRLYSEIQVENRICDHRLSVLFPSLNEGESYFCDTPFDFLYRPIGRREEFLDSFEKEVECHPQSSFTGVAAGGKGLAVISDGLKEGAVLEREGHPVAQTMIRAYRKFQFRNGEADSQMTGVWNFPFIIQPIFGEPDEASLLNSARELQGTVRTVQIGKDQLFSGRFLETPPCSGGGFLDLRGGAVLSSLRKKEGTLEIRLWNPSPGVKPCEIRLDSAFLRQSGLKEWYAADFRGERTGGGGSLEKGVISLSLKPKEIKNIRLGHDEG